MSGTAKNRLCCAAPSRGWRQGTGWAWALVLAALLGSCRAGQVGPNRALKLAPKQGASQDESSPGSAAVPSFPGAQGKGVVRAIRGGKAFYSESFFGPDARRQKLLIGHRLVAGNTVGTDGAATVDLYLAANGPLVRLLPGTALRLDEVRFSSNEGRVTISTRLRLEQGRILAAVRKLETGSVYEVVTPKGTYRARGTAFDLSADGRLVVLEGAVERTADGTPLVMKAGEVFDHQSGTIRPASPEIIAELRKQLRETGAATDWLP